MNLSALRKGLDVLESALEANDVDGAKIILRSIQYDVIAAQQGVQPTVLCTCETIDTQVTKLLNCECPVHGSHIG